MRPEDLHWLAGLMEGEASFCFHRANGRGERYPSIYLAMTDEDVVARAASLIQRKLYSYQPSGSPTKGGRKRLFAVRIHGVGAAELMRTLFPLMGVRRQAKIAEILKVYKGPISPQQRAENLVRYMSSLTEPERKAHYYASGVASGASRRAKRTHVPPSA